MMIITDTECLLTDLQRLLTHPHPTPKITVSNGVLSLPAQLLSVRNPYFKALLSSPWYRPHVTKPNASVEVFQDLLEFLVTGCVTLSSSPSAIPHNLHLAILANETLATDLEEIVVAHIANHLSYRTFSDYLHNLHSPLQSIEHLLTNFLKSNIRLVQTLSKSPQTVKNVCQILSAKRLPSKLYHDLARYILSSTTITNLRRNTPVKHCILTFPTQIFIRHFEHLNIFTRAELLGKYRHDARSTPTPQVQRLRTWLMYESTHPLGRYARFDETVTCVTLPPDTHANIVFHRRTSLGRATGLAFFDEDPALGVEPCICFTFIFYAFVIRSNRFWFRLSWLDYDEDEVDDGVRSWGWRIFVEPCAPRVEFNDH